MKQKKTITLLLLAVTQLLVVLDGSIINVALPAIKEALHFTNAELQWVITGYILTFGGFLMLGGRTADLFGRRRVLLWGIAGFTFVSLLLGFSQTSGMLVALRALQGLAAAFMAPAALSILLTSFPEGPERHKALSVWSLVASGGAAVGVLLGGVLTQTLGWQWNFFVNVPIGILAIIGIRRFLPQDAPATQVRNLDVPGALLVTLGLMALVYALTIATELGWTAYPTLGWLLASLVLLIGFIWNESRSKHPLIPLSIFKNRNVTGGNIMMFPVIAGAFGMFFFSSLYIQNILQYSPIMTGLSFLPVPITIGILSRYAPRLVGKFGFKRLLVVGSALITTGITMLSFVDAQAVYVTQLLPVFILMGLGMGLTFVSATIAATSGVKPDQAGLASGLINTSQQIGGALGVAILAVVASGATASALAAGQPELLANLQGYKQAFMTSAIMMFGALLIALFIIRTPKQSGALAAQPEPAAH